MITHPNDNEEIAASMDPDKTDLKDADYRGTI